MYNDDIHFEHIMKCIVFGNSLNNLNHWCDEVASSMQNINKLKTKNNTKLKENEYLDNFLLSHGDTKEDFEYKLKTLSQTWRNKYPKFEITKELINKTYNIFIDLASYLAPILNKVNNYNKDYFKSKLMDYFNDYEDMYKD